MRYNASTLQRGPEAFTLIEVLLAIIIAIGLLVVALHFYSQAANLRAQLLEESERNAAIRLVMDRVTADLRSAFAQPQYGFTGDSGSMRFVTAQALPRSAWMPATASPAGSPKPDLKIVTYGTSATLDGTNLVVLGFTRTEQALLETPPLPKAADALPATVGSTNLPGPALQPLTDAIRFLRLCYWNGHGWFDTWESDQLPRGVEVTLGVESLPPGALPSEYDGEIFRRIVYLPASRETAEALSGFGPLATPTQVVTQTP